MTLVLLGVSTTTTPKHRGPHPPTHTNTPTHAPATLLKAVPPLNTTSAGVASSVCRDTVEHRGSRSRCCCGWSCCCCGCSCVCCWCCWCCWSGASELWFVRTASWDRSCLLLLVLAPLCWLLPGLLSSSVAVWVAAEESGRAAAGQTALVSPSSANKLGGGKGAGSLVPCRLQ